MKIHTSNQGVTLLEMVVSLALLSLISASAVGALSMSNRHAMVARMQSLAENMARDRMDHLQTVGPFNPQNESDQGGAQVPNDLILDGDRGGAVTHTLPLYVDPRNNQTIVTATRRTSIGNAGNYNARTLRVRVEYTFRGRNYVTNLNSIRTSDAP